MFQLSCLDLLVQALTAAPRLVLEMSDEVRVKGSSFEIFHGFKVQPPFFIVCHVRNETPSKINVSCDITALHASVDQAINKCQLDYFFGYLTESVRSLDSILFVSICHEYCFYI